MKIRKLNATFGKLSRKTLELGDGLNVIYGGNESGKSTWCGFIRAMLYGINTREQTKAGFIADKERYRPWSGEAMYGSMEVEWNRRQLKIERVSGRGGIFGTAITTDMSTGLTATDIDVPGESMLGMKKEVFERSAFIGQTLLKVENDKSGELEKRIVSMAGSGDEEVSHSVVNDRLKAWKNRRKYQSRGEIPELEGRIADILGAVNSLRNDTCGLTMARTRIEALRRDEKKLSAQAEVWKSLRAWERVNLNQDAQAEYDAAQSDYSNALESARMGDFMPDTDFLENLARKYQRYVDDEKNYTISMENMRKADAELTAEREKLADFGALADIAKGDAQTALSRAQVLSDGMSKRSFPTALLVGALVGILLSCGLFAAKLPVPVPVWSPAAALSLIALVAQLVINRTRSKKKVEMRAELDAILALYGAADIPDILPRAEKCTQQKYAVEKSAAAKNAVENNMERMDLIRHQSRDELSAIIKLAAPEACEGDAPRIIEDIRAKLGEIAAAASRVETARVRLETVKAGQNLDEFLKDTAACPEGTEKPEFSEDELRAKLGEINSEIRKLEIECSVRETRIEQTGYTGDLTEQLGSARDELSKKLLEYSAIECAMDELSGANGEMQRKFAPSIEKKASEIFHHLTGGHFSLVEIQNAQMDVRVREESAAEPRQVLELSQGTADELYLSMRLALSYELAGDEAPPLILDDALVNFDDERMARTLDYLSELAKSRQIVLFSCQSREAEYVKDRADVHIQSL